MNFVTKKFYLDKQFIEQKKKFDETGSVEDAPRSGRPTTVRTEDNSQLVSETFRLNPQSSQRRASRYFNISRTSLQRLMKDLNLKPYKPRLLQALNEDDSHRRLGFCEWILDSIQNEGEGEGDDKSIVSN